MYDLPPFIRNVTNIHSFTSDVEGVAALAYERWVFLKREVDRHYDNPAPILNDDDVARILGQMGAWEDVISLLTHYRISRQRKRAEAALNEKFGIKPLA